SDENYNSDEFDESDKFDGLNKSDKFDEFNESVNPSGLDESNEKSKIISEFMAADMRIQELSTSLREYLNVKHTSRFINTHEIARQYKERSDKINITNEIF
ncbi:17566_t:CDS:1, partial [Cetraspora pellucida]